jgi:hypothetical protein
MQEDRQKDEQPVESLHQDYSLRSLGRGFRPVHWVGTRKMIAQVGEVIAFNRLIAVELLIGKGQITGFLVI